jgi:hypothetical protein
MIVPLLILMVLLVAFGAEVGTPVRRVGGPRHAR